MVRRTNASATFDTLSHSCVDVPAEEEWPRSISTSRQLSLSIQPACFGSLIIIIIGDEPHSMRISRRSTRLCRQRFRRTIAHRLLLQTHP